MHPTILTLQIIFLTLFLLLVVLIWVNIKRYQQLKSTENSIQSNNTEQYKSAPTSTEAQEKSARNRYLSSISHELRTPLNVIMGYAQLLENQADENDINKEKYTLMRHNCEHLAHLIESILEFSAIESGRLKVQFEWVNLSDLIKQVSLMFKNQAEKKGLTFVTNIEKNLPETVKTDHRRLQQILINLLSNAVKFTEQGEIIFGIKYRNQVATFTISDTGCGIDDTDVERIFIPFERIEQSPTKVPGTGLGLPITQMLAELLGGELKVQSTPGSGTTFTYKMMLAPQTAFSQAATIENPALKNNPKLNKAHRLLIVDDDSSHRQLLREILTPLSCTVDEASDGSKAQIMLKKQTYDLIIIDVAMPNINGWQLAQWVNQHQPETKIIMLSGNPRDTEQSQSIQYHNYLTKPVNITQLMTHISDALNLEWQQPKNHKTNNDLSPVTISAEDFSALQNMAEIGHINGIEDYLDKMYKCNCITNKQFEQLIKPIKAMNLTQFNSMIIKQP